MAATARNTGLHLLHRHMRIGITGFEQFSVAVITTEERRMKLVAENDRAEIRNTDWNFFCHMAKAAFR